MLSIEAFGIVSNSFLFVFDKFTIESILYVFTESTEFVKAVKKRTGLKIACLEVIGYWMGWISKNDVAKQISGLKGNYYKYVSIVVV